jgi:hypothetical protein
MNAKNSMHKGLDDELPLGAVNRGTLVSLAVVVSVIVVIVATVLPMLSAAREASRQNTCNCQLKGWVTALYAYQTRVGFYPGYMNALERTDGSAYVDPDTGKPTPVSWVVMLLPEVDRQKAFDLWRAVSDEKGIAGANGQPKAAVDKAPDEGKSGCGRLFCCPSDPGSVGTPFALSYVPNTGMIDLPAAMVGADPKDGLPRDWLANGMFFDNFSEHPLIKTDAESRGPMVLLKDRMVRDPMDKTIMLTENVDATGYVFHAGSQSADGWRAVEIQTGCIWRPGPIDTSKPLPAMTSPTASLHINVDAGKGNGTSYDYCRPSSHHPRTVNVAYVGTNVAALHDKISYFVYSKLMASDDAHVAEPGKRYSSTDPASDTIGAAFRKYDLSDADISP